MHLGKSLYDKLTKNCLLAQHEYSVTILSIGNLNMLDQKDNYEKLAILRSTWELG